MAHAFCPGYSNEPFATLVPEYPAEDVFPPRDFRSQWGPLARRGRLDGSARVLVIGQDPAGHPTFRESASAAGQLSPAGATASLLGNWKPRLDVSPQGVQAQRTGREAKTKRATITTTVPVSARPWLTRGRVPGTEDPAPGPPAGPATRPDAGRSAAHEETRHGA